MSQNSARKLSEMPDVKAKGLDEMKLTELCEMITGLGLSDEGLEGRADAKSLIENAIKLNTTTSWSPGKFSTIASNAKEGYDRKREKLLKSYIDCKEILTKACKEFPLLQQFIGTDIEKHISHLKQREYFLFVTGETSAGKSHLINLLLEDEILPSAHKRVTSTICEIKYGKQRKIKVYFKSKDPETGRPTREIPLKQPSDGSPEQSYVEQIHPFVSENASLYKKIELFWPHRLLQQGIVIVDTPGLGESQELNDMVYQYLPKVFAYIFVLSVSEADGIKNETIGKLCKMVKNVSRGFTEETGEYPATTFPIEEGMYGSKMTSDLQEFLLSKCTLFVSNKWDRVPKEEVQDVKDVSISKLKQIWPGFDPKSQLIFISAKYATVALRQLKSVTEEFDSLMNGMKGLITNSINARLECSWRLLYDMLSEMIAQTESFLETNSSKLENVEEEIKKVNCILEYIENHGEETMKGIHSRFLTFEDEASKRVREYFSSADVKARFARWTKDEVPQEGSDWEKTKRSIEEAFYSRLQETLERWLKDDMLLERAEEFLHEELKKYFDVPKDQCPLGVLGDSSKMNIGVRYRMAENSSYEGLIMGGAFAFLTAITWLFNPVASLAIRVGVAAFPATLSALGLSVEGFERLEARWVKGEFQKSREAFMSKHSKLFLDFVKDVPKNFVKLQLKPVKQKLSKAGPTLSTLIRAKREQVAQFENEERSLEEVKKAHARISEEGCRLRGHHVVGVTEMCPMIQISREALKWKEGFSSPIGRGTFGDIYEAEMTKDGKSKTVALEVYRIELNDKNAPEIVDEIEILRKLQGHSHIVQFHGVSFREKDVAFIFEKCTGSLADYIFRDKKTLVSTESTKHSAIPEKFQWAREIIDGLVFMHAQNVVHSNLKPENILLSEENVIKIAHVGLAKPVDVITETVAGTYSYTAPEVIDSKEYDRKSDIYSLGIILWEIWYGQRAYECWHGTVQEFFAWLKDGNRPGDKSSNEPPWKQLMMQCWDGNPKTRPPAWACKNEIKRVESF